MRADRQTYRHALIAKRCTPPGDEFKNAYSNSVRTSLWKFFYCRCCSRPNFRLSLIMSNIQNTARMSVFLFEDFHARIKKVRNLQCWEFLSEDWVQEELMNQQELSGCWDGRPFGRNRHGPKVGRGCCGWLGPHLTQCGVVEAYLFTKWHLDPSNRLATTVGMPLSYCSIRIKI